MNVLHNISMNHRIALKHFVLKMRNNDVVD